MRTLLIFLAAIVVIVLGLWATLVLYFDEDKLKQIATEQVRAQTGRDLIINGPLKLDFFPGISLVASDVELSGPDNYSGPDLFTADEFRMSLSLMPLLSGNVETGDIGLQEAEVNIHTDLSGISSLDGLAGGEAPAETTSRQANVSTGQIRLSGIRLNVTDAATDSRQVFVVDRLQVDSFSYDKPVPFEFQGSVGEPPVISDIDLKGEVVVPSGAGPIQIARLEADANLSGVDMGLSGSGEIRPGPPLAASFADGRIQIGDSEFTTGFSYIDGPRPKLEATLEGDMLDVDALLASMPAPAAQSPASGNSGAAPEESPLLLLRDVDLDAELVLEEMKISGLTLNSIRTRVLAENGLVTIDPLSGALAGGRLDAVGRVDLNAEPPSIRLSPVFDLESLGQALAPWGMDRFLTGSGVLDLDLNARGLDVKSILGSLNGGGEYDFRDGSIKGLNLDGMVQSLAARNVAEAVRTGVGGTTAFQTLEGVVSIEDGTISLPGMQIITELLGISGDVRIGMADFSLDGQIRLEGERLNQIPIALEGTLTKPRLVPDVGDALKEEAGRRVMDFLKKRGESEEEKEEGKEAGDGG
ncbi:MAG TPA: AsmA family protein [Wenzhouxiangellaceae bacterium]|nr:AsmA family protein [Wenzhouxiangellaceae bacterium]